MKSVAGQLRLDLAQYRELAAFAQFGSDLDKSTMARLNRGEKVQEVLKQGQYEPFPVEEQVVSIYCGVNGWLDDIPTDRIKAFEVEFIKFMRSSHPEILKGIKESKVIGDEEGLKKAIEEFKAIFAT
jgi:F-type H+-transporting ATPase subunit alpha